MKHHAGKVLIVAGVFTLLVAFQHKARAGGEDDDRSSTEQSRIQVGFKIAPVPLDLAHKNPELVGLGSYIANAVGGCNDCHTNPFYLPGGNPFQGEKKIVNSAHYLAGGQAFGPFISRNLTPQNGLPAGRTYAEFKNIMRTGIDLNHLHPQISPLLQVMPWPTYQEMTEHELRAIYEYLSAIPPATPGP